MKSIFYKNLHKKYRKNQEFKYFERISKEIDQFHNKIREIDCLLEQKAKKGDCLAYINIEELTSDNINELYLYYKEQGFECYYTFWNKKTSDIQLVITWKFLKKL